MAEFAPAMKVVLHHEGGYVNNKSDPGGETNFGISKRKYPSVDIKELTVDQARYIYRRDFWEPGRFEKIYSQVVATKAFDLSVNMGLRWGIRILQKSVKRLGRLVKVDGKLGPKTIKAVNSLGHTELMKEIRVQAALRYANIAVKRPESAVFLRIWMRRALF